MVICIFQLCLIYLMLLLCHLLPLVMETRKWTIFPVLVEVGTYKILG